MRVVFHWLIRRSTLALYCASILSCTYGPPTTRRTIDGALAQMNTRRFGVVVRTEIIRPPTGLSKFPDGGSEQKIDQFVTIFAGDVDSGTVRRVGKMSAPADMSTAFQATLLGLRSNGVYTVLTGCPKSDCGTTRPTRRYYRFGYDGSVEKFDGEPADIEHQPGMVSRSPGETVYTRVGTHGDSITVVTVDNGRFVPRYVLNSSGDIEPLPRAFKP